MGEWENGRKNLTILYSDSFSFLPFQNRQSTMGRHNIRTLVKPLHPDAPPGLYPGGPPIPGLHPIPHQKKKLFHPRPFFPPFSILNSQFPPLTEEG